jgi:galactose mutarotase-like enzyme
MGEHKMLTIENEKYFVQVNPVGAELSGIRSKKDGYEYMWEGDPAIWKGRSPLLFPVVGRLRNDTYRYQGTAYHMPKHGFLMHETFRVKERTENVLALVFDDWRKHQDIYPFRYSVEVLFVLSESGLTVTHTVTNLQDAPMYFSLGAHPAFRCLPGGRLEFPLPENAPAWRFDAEKIIRPERDAFLENETAYDLKPETFADDAYVLEDIRSPFVRVRNAAENRSVRVYFGGAPYLGIWAKPAAPYVCIEPWFGLDDDYYQSGNIEDKKGIVRLAAGARHIFTYSVEPEGE